MKKRATIMDIARLAGVNVSTVSRALANHPHISEDKKAAIRKLAVELQYYRNDLAKSLRLKITKVLGLIIPDIQNPFYPSITRVIEDSAQEKGYIILLGNSDFDQKKEEQYLTHLLGRQVDGLIIFPTLQLLYTEKSKIFDNFKIPVVFMDTVPMNGVHGNFVYTDNEYGAYAATKYLIDNGHRNIILFTGKKDLLSSLEQMEKGYRHALRDSGLQMNSSLIFRSDLEEKGDLERSAYGLLGRRPDMKFTAILCNSDVVARSVYEQASKFSISIPDDLSVVGYDNTFLCSYLQPQLTSVNQPGYDLGKTAVDLFFNQTKNMTDRQGKVVVFTPQLVIRNSVRSIYS